MIKQGLAVLACCGLLVSGISSSANASMFGGVGHIGSTSLSTDTVKASFDFGGLASKELEKQKKKLEKAAKKKLKDEQRKLKKEAQKRAKELLKQQKKEAKRKPINEPPPYTNPCDGGCGA